MNSGNITPLPYINFWNSEMLDGLWQYLKAYMWLGAPLIMIMLALMVSDQLINMIIDVFSKKKRKDEEEDEEEYYYY